jgi:hypothetical protein
MLKRGLILLSLALTQFRCSIAQGGLRARSADR